MRFANLKRRSIVIAAVALSGIIILSVFGVVTSRDEFCKTCKSARTIETIGLRLPIVPRFEFSFDESFAPSHAALQLVESHPHVWRLRGGVVRSLLWRDQCMNGSVVHNIFSETYESEPAFRDYVDLELQAGRITQAQIQQFVALPGPLESASPRTPAMTRRLDDAASFLERFDESIRSRESGSPARRSGQVR